MPSPVPLDWSASTGGQDENTARWLRLRGRDGVHTHEMYAMGVANPAVRKFGLDLVCERQALREAGPTGVRYWLRAQAPARLHDAPAVKAAKTKSSPAAHCAAPLASVSEEASGRDTRASSLTESSSTPDGSANTASGGAVERHLPVRGEPAPSLATPERPSPAGSPPPGPSNRAAAGLPQPAAAPQLDLFGEPPISRHPLTPYQEAA